MQVIKVGRQSLQATVVDTVRILEEGGVIVYPTETAYGLGVNALNEAAVAKVFAIKGRDYKKPLSVLVKDKKMAERYVHFSPIAVILFQEFIPGPLTMVLPRKAPVPASLTGSYPTLGLRVSSHPFVQALFQKINFPLTATSANLSGEKNIYSYAVFQKQFSDKGLAERLAWIDTFFDAGTLSPILPSTVLDLTVSPPKILRPGPISARQIEAVLGLRIDVS